MVESIQDTEDDIYYTDRLLDFLEKLKIKSAFPCSDDEAIRRSLTAPIDGSFNEEVGLSLYDILKRVR